MQKMEDTFKLDPGSKALIYGAGAFAQSIYSKIKGIYEIECFIDRRAYLITGLEIPVYDMDHISEFQKNTVIICVHNANWHYEIAEELYAHGFEKIIFLAMSDVYLDKQAMIMNQIYNLFIEGQYAYLDQIPYYQKMKTCVLEENIIRENENYVTAWCGKDLLYSWAAIADHYKDKMTKESLRYRDAPMIANKPYISLFRFFMYGVGSAELHIKVNKIFNNSFDMSDEQFLQDQYGVYCLLERQYEKGRDAFLHMPIDVAWNPRGYFNIIDGQHRCAFYWLKGMQYMPVRMKREDYDLWMNGKCLERVKKILYEKNAIPAIRINHPVLQEYTYSSREYEITVLDVLQEWLYGTGQTFQSILELSSYQAYYGRSIYRTRKTEKITSVVNGKEDADLAYALCALQYIPEHAVRIAGSLQELADEKQKFELGLVCGTYDTEELIKNIGKLDAVITDCLFWQSGPNPQAEKDYILAHSDFRNYTHLATKCLEGMPCEIGVFMK